MFVIYNKGAFLLAFISLVLMALLNWVVPADWMHARKGMLLFFGVVTVVGGAMEFSNMRPRIFFLPVFLWGALFLCILMYASFGTMGLIATFAVTTAFASTIYLYLKKLDNKNWGKAKTAFITASAMELDPENTNLWTTLEQALYHPIVSKVAPDIKEQNSAITKIITLLLTEEENQQLLEHMNNNYFSSDFELYNALTQVIQSKSKQLKINNRIKAGTAG